MRDVDLHLFAVCIESELVDITDSGGGGNLL